MGQIVGQQVIGRDGRRLVALRQSGEERRFGERQFPQAAVADGAAQREAAASDAADAAAAVVVIVIGSPLNDRQRP